MFGNASIEEIIQDLVLEAEFYKGATTPNPPVGAAILDSNGRVIGRGFHHKAGEAHAEINALRNCQQQGELFDASTMVVTLEPCSHFGRTPPCTRAIIETHIKKVIVGTLDPNPRVKGSGVEELRNKGIEVEVLQGNLQELCRDLIRSYSHWMKTQRPWVTLKRALREENGSLTMNPPKGQKTFTSEESLFYAHKLRRRADAIITGSGTVINDLPEFTVRKLPDHYDKRRWLVVLDRRGRVPDEWATKAKDNGFELISDLNLQEALDFLGKQGALEVLIEAGPTLSQEILDQQLWNEQVTIVQKNEEENIEVSYRNPTPPAQAQLNS